MLTSTPTLVIGNKNYSSWSLRPWLLMRHFDVYFEELQVSLTPPNAKQRLLQYSPVGKVPVLLHDEHVIWDSLAICEYVNERFLRLTGWPDDRIQRAQARSICAEMHSGFHAMRQQLPMNVNQRRSVTLSEAVKQDIARIDEIWAGCSKVSATGWLFDQFSIADCFYAPVALRFQTYNISLSDDAAEYCQKLLHLPAVRHWIVQARKESERIADADVGLKLVE